MKGGRFKLVTKRINTEKEKYVETNSLECIAKSLMLNPTDKRSQKYLCQLIGTNRIMEENKESEKEEKFLSDIFELYQPINYVDLLRLNLYRMSYGDYSTNINDKSYSDFDEVLASRYQLQINACENDISIAIHYYLENWKSYSYDIYYYYELCLLLSLTSNKENAINLIEKVLDMLDSPSIKSKTPNYDYIRGAIVVFQILLAKKIKNVYD